MKFKPLVCEFIGAFALCFSGFLAVHNMGRSHELGGLLMVAFAFGLPIACLGSAFGAISGAHFNPAVTLGFLVIKKIDVVSAIGYIVVQLLGAYAASMLLGAVPGFDKGQAVPFSGAIGTPVAFILEAVATFFLMTVVMGTAVDGRGPKIGAIAIGLTVTFGIIAIGPLTSGCLNPARYFGPALAGGKSFREALVYLAGPIVGAVSAAILYKSLFLESTPEPEPAA